MVLLVITLLIARMAEVRLMVSLCKLCLIIVLGYNWFEACDPNNVYFFSFLFHFYFLLRTLNSQPDIYLAIYLKQ
jgi:hypothetical protein